MTDQKNGNNNVHTISVLVANKPGVLARIALVFSRRAFNINSLVVSPAVNKDFSRMTITAIGGVSSLDQIIKQVSKLVDVVHCYEHVVSESIIKELSLIKVKTCKEDRTEILQISEHFACKTVDLTEDSLVIMGTGDSSKLDALVGLLENFDVIEVVRTGKVIMARGNTPT